MKRMVQPEILDALPHDDPQAIRSRRDLRLINALMGNFRWLRRRIAAHGGGRIVELGAGDGGLLARLASDGRETTGIDFAPRPESLVEAVQWIQGDIFEQLGEAVQGDAVIVVANLFLHHFEPRELGKIGELIRDARVLCFAEPYRSPLAMAQGYALWPLVNRVTRQDMMVSIKAGFKKGELPALLKLNSDHWLLNEQCTWRGGYRLLASRRT